MFYEDIKGIGVGNSDSPLPLPYQIDGKHTENITANEQINNRVKKESEKPHRKLLVSIGNPLPLDYLNSDKNDSSFDDDENKIDNKEFDKKDDEIGNDPMGSVDDFDDQNHIEVSHDVEKLKEKKKKKHHILLSDIGKPLPLSYELKPNIEIDSKAQLNLNMKKNEIHFQEKNHSNNIATRRLVSKIDFGLPLPLEYVNEKINTDDYLKWKNSRSLGTFVEWRESEGYVKDEKIMRNNTSHFVPKLEHITDISHSDVVDIKPFKKENSDDQIENMTSQISKNDSSVVDGLNSATNELVSGQNEESDKTGLEDDEHTPSTIEDKIDDKITQEAMDKELHQYIETMDYDGLSEKIEDVDFRLRLMRYTRQLKRQYDFLSKVLQTESHNEPTTVKKLPKTQYNIAQSFAVSIIFFIIICTISYYLAD